MRAKGTAPDTMPDSSRATPDPPGAGPSAGSPALALRGVVAGYGATVVLHGLSLEVAQGGTLALLGRNGMGKSTLARAVAGLLPVSRGEILFGAEAVTSLPPAARVARGLAYAPQERALFQDLSVRDNLRLALRSDREFARRLDEVVPLFPVLGRRLRQVAGTLSGGEQKMLLLARALLTRPRLMVLDEISEGLQPSVVDSIAAALLERLRDGRTGLVLIEQNIRFALHVASRWAVLERGEVVASGDAAEAGAADRVADLLAL